MQTVEGSNVLVSVVMNCHNGAEFLREAIDSVYLQSHDNFEIIFWDNCSSDDSAVIAHSYDARIRYYKSKNKLLLGEARHEAIKKTRGKYITFLDCDDVWLENKLETQINGLENSDYLFSYGGYHVIDANSKIKSSHRARYKSGFIFKNLLVQYDICMQCVMLDRKILISNSMNFDKSFEYCPDYDLFMRIASKYPIMVCDQFLTKYRVTGNSLSSKTKHLTATEVRKSIDNALSSPHQYDPSYKSAIKQAYAKATFYEALFNLSVDDKKLAVRLLRTICMIRIEYFFLYLILLFPISGSSILRVIRR